MEKHKNLMKQIMDALETLTRYIEESDKYISQADEFAKEKVRNAEQEIQLCTTIEDQIQAKLRRVSHELLQRKFPTYLNQVLNRNLFVVFFSMPSVLMLIFGASSLQIQPIESLLRHLLLISGGCGASRSLQPVYEIVLSGLSIKLVVQQLPKGALQLQFEFQMQAEVVQKPRSKKEPLSKKTESDFTTVEELEQQQQQLLRKQQFAGKAIAKYKDWRRNLKRRSDKPSRGILQYAEAELQQWRDIELTNGIKLKQITEQINQSNGCLHRMPKQINHVLKKPKAPIISRIRQW